MMNEENIKSATVNVKLVFVNNDDLTEEDKENTIATIRVGVISSPFKKVVDNLIKALNKENK